MDFRQLRPKNLWRWLTEPPARLNHPELRRRSRLLLSLLSVLLLLAILVFLFEWVELAFTTDPTQRYWVGVVYPLVVGSALVFLLIAYILGRTGYTGFAGLIVVIVTLVASYSMIFVSKTSDTVSFSIIGAILSSMLLSRRQTIVILAVTLLSTLALPFVVPEITFWSITGGLIFMLPVGALSLVFASIHNRDLKQIEDQARVLIESQERILGARKMESIARMSAGIAHEFNNIAMAIVGYSEVIAAKPAEKVLQYSQLIKGAGLRASRLTEKLLSFSRQQLLNPKATDLNQLIAGIARLLHSMVDERIRLTLQLGREPAISYVDPDLIGQVVQTLLGRAKENVSAGGDISIGTGVVVVARDSERPSFPPGRYCAITIKDTGPLTDKETLNRIFDPYFTEGDFGTGDLDLAAAYGIVTQSDGHIEVSSDPEHGNAFVVLLPERGDPIVGSSASHRDRGTAE